MSSFEAHVVAVVATLGRGEVVSYGDVAADAGHAGAARAVGALLARSTADLPWWRVVRADGGLVTAPGARQAARLRAEGVVVRGGRVLAAPVGRFATASPQSAMSKTSATSTTSTTSAAGRRTRAGT